MSENIFDITPSPIRMWWQPQKSLVADLLNQTFPPNYQEFLEESVRAGAEYLLEKHKEDTSMFDEHLQKGVKNIVATAIDFFKMEELMRCAQSKIITYKKLSERLYLPKIKSL